MSVTCIHCGMEIPTFGSVCPFCRTPRGDVGGQAYGLGCASGLITLAVIAWVIFQELDKTLIGAVVGAVAGLVCVRIAPRLVLLAMVLAIFGVPTLWFFFPDILFGPVHGRWDANQVVEIGRLPSVVGDLGNNMGNFRLSALNTQPRYQSAYVGTLAKRLAGRQVSVRGQPGTIAGVTHEGTQIIYIVRFANGNESRFRADDFAEPVAPGNEKQ